MSFGFPPRTKCLDPIHRAILAADAECVVLFAAARNGGGMKRIAYPADQPEVICVNSTDGEGNRSHFNPSPEYGKRLSTLGEDVLSSWPGGVPQRKSGTSYATPIAAGIAGIVMDYVMQRSKNWTEEEQYIASKIRGRTGILAVMEKHLSRERDGFRFLAPWEFFCKDNVGEIDKVLLHTLRTV